MPVDRTTAYGPNLDLDIADRLLEIYGRAERELAADIARRLQAGMDAPDWARQKLAQAGALRRSVQALLSRLATDDGTIAQALVLAYMRGGEAATAEILRLGRQVPAAAETEALQDVLDATGTGVQRALSAAVRAFPQLGALQRMVWGLASRLAGTHLPVLRWAVDSYREVVAEGALAPVLLGTATRRAGTQRAWERLLTQGVTGFHDKAGRAWNLASYVEMATRTGVAQAAVEGHLDRLSAAKLDLVIVSNAPQECVRCRPWEGKVLARSGGIGPRTVEMPHAISGTPVEVEVAGTVAEAIAAGLMHPNCRHSLSAYLPGVTRIPTNTEDPEGDEARQRLRALERIVRKAKLQQAGAMTPEAAKRAEEKIRAGQAAIRAHVKATKHLGIFRKPEREQVNLGHTTAADAGRPARSAPAPAAKPKPKPASAAAAPTVPADAAPYHRDLTGLADLAAHVANAGRADRKVIAKGEQAGVKERLTMPDGTKVFSKAYADSDPDSRHYADAEQLAALVGRTIGAPVPRAYRTGERHIYTDWADGTDVHALRKRDRARAEAALDSPAAKRLGLLDLLTGNIDRHEGNMFVAKDGTLTGIDQGLAWTGSDNLLDETSPIIRQAKLLGFMQGPALDHFRASSLELGPNPLTADDVAELRRRLTGLRPDFEHVDRGSWLDFSLAVLDMLAGHTAGERSIFDG
ncbi:phage minor capsid protein [Catellatospora coxensis]|uniref:Uncharacterized protein n=1 Tax=Catellatospora coxensis TaxID=310354 RepID=A0A8J3L0E9_9ACTN|nr:phage minor capsid protein [Catellatospora coxensis]GIG10205.1 hypothetical protein Cco03nite_69050 [Catellatospora coxensis]